MPSREQEKAMFASLKKGREVRIKKGDLEGHFGVITRVTDDDDQRFLRIKIDKLQKSVEKTPDEVKLIPELMLEQEFNTIEDFKNKEEWFLSSGDDAEFTKEFIADRRKDEFDGFMVLIKEGEIEQAYGFNGEPILNKCVTRLETADEHLARVIV